MAPEFTELHQTLGRNLRFLHDNGIVEESIAAPNGFDLIGMPARSAPAAEFNAACDAADKRVRMAQMADPIAAKEVRKAIATLRDILTSQDRLTAYLKAIAPKPKPVALPSQPPIHPEGRAPSPAASGSRNHVAAARALVAVAGLTFVVLRPKSAGAVAPSSPKPTTIKASSASTKPPVAKPDATQELAQVDRLVTQAIGLHAEYHTGKMQGVRPDERKKARAKELCRLALTTMRSLEGGRDLTREQTATLVSNRAISKAFVGDESYVVDMNLARSQANALPKSPVKETILQTTSLLAQTIPGRNGEATKKIW